MQSEATTSHQYSIVSQNDGTENKTIQHTSNKGTVESPFFQACRTGESETVSQMLTENKKLANAQCLSKDTSTYTSPLFVSLEHPDVVNSLLEAGANLNDTFLEHATGKFITVLEKSVEPRYAEAFSILLEHQTIDVNVKNDAGVTPLMHASMIGNNQAIEALLKKDATINDTSRENWTALMFAAEYGYPEAASLLVSYGANVDLQNTSGDTALIISARKDHDSVAEILVEKKCDINIVNNLAPEHRLNAVQTAAANGSCRVLQILTPMTNPELLTQYSETLLMLAVINNNYEALRYLLEYANKTGNRDLPFVNVNFQQKPSGFTALMRAISLGWQESAMTLLENKATSVNISTPDKFTALDIAAKMGMDVVVERLLRCGATQNTTIKKNITTFDKRLFHAHPKPTALKIAKFYKPTLFVPKRIASIISPQKFEASERYKRTITHLVENVRRQHHSIQSDATQATVATTQFIQPHLEQYTIQVQQQPEKKPVTEGKEAPDRQKAVDCEGEQTPENIKTKNKGKKGKKGKKVKTVTQSSPTKSDKSVKPEHSTSKKQKQKALEKGKPVPDTTFDHSKGQKPQEIQLNLIKSLPSPD